MVALVTPMHENGDIDFDCMRELVDWHLAQGTDAIIAAGTTGEAATLSDLEKIDVIRCVVEQVKERCPVIAGTAANETKNTMESIKSVSSKGSSRS